jgi:hypothetical protein
MIRSNKQNNLNLTKKDQKQTNLIRLLPYVQKSTTQNHDLHGSPKLKALLQTTPQICKRKKKKKKKRQLGQTTRPQS